MGQAVLSGALSFGLSEAGRGISHLANNSAVRNFFRSEQGGTISFPGGKTIFPAGGRNPNALGGWSNWQNFAADETGSLGLGRRGSANNGAGKNIEWTNHGYKHFPQKNMSWKDIIKSTRSGPAKYSLGTDIEALERMAWKKGTSVTNGKTWKVMKFDNVIGASGGAETNYMRVEMSGGTIHGHPITKNEYLKLIK